MDSCLIFRRERLGISYSLVLPQKNGVEFIDLSVGNGIYSFIYVNDLFQFKSNCSISSSVPMN